jgi:hypothetical protein
MSFFATKTARYWRFSMRDAGIASGFYQIGELWLGKFKELTRWHAANANETRDTGMKQHETDGGVRWRLSGFQRRSRTYRFEGITEDGDALTWRQVFEHRGRERPFFYIVNPAVPSSAFFGVFAGPLAQSNTIDDLITMDVRLDEEL